VARFDEEAPLTAACASPADLEKVDRANASGKQPVVFVHGRWLLDSSWDHWAQFFEAAGYVAVAPTWPDDPPTVEAARADPSVFAGKSVGDVAAYQQAIIEKPTGTGRWPCRSSSSATASVTP
jgi:non-heme chloroperoxidase